MKNVLPIFFLLFVVSAASTPQAAATTVPTVSVAVSPNPAMIGVSTRFSQHFPVEQRKQRGAFFVIAPTRNTDPTYSFIGAGGET